MALDWKMYSVFVFYLFWNAWCHSKSWYRAHKPLVRAFYLLVLREFLFFLFCSPRLVVSKQHFFRHFFNFLLMLFWEITVCVCVRAHEAQSIKAQNSTSTLFFISKHLSFIPVLHIRPLHLCVGNPNSTFHRPHSPSFFRTLYSSLSFWLAPISQWFHFGIGYNCCFYHVEKCVFSLAKPWSFAMVVEPKVV